MNDVIKNVKELHQNPKFSVITEAWIPIQMLDVSFKTLSLEEVFLKAHLIKDVVSSNALELASLRRFLITISYSMLSEEFEEESAWFDKLLNNEGFPEELVKTYFADNKELFYLLHPTTPFLQDASALARLTSPKPSNIKYILLETPGESAAAWVYKGTDDPALKSKLNFEEMARALAVRWYYHLNGNTSGVNGLDVSPQEGSCFSEGMADLTHIFRISPRSLFVTLCRNLDSEVLEKGGKLAWRTNDLPRNFNILLPPSVSTHSTLIAGAENKEFTSFLKTRINGRNEEIKIFRDAVRDNDPHRITTFLKGGTKPSTLRLSLQSHRLHQINFMRRHVHSLNAEAEKGISHAGSLWIQSGRFSEEETIELLLASKAGDSKSPKWQDAMTIHLPSQYVDAEKIKIDSLLTACFDYKDGFESSLRRAVLFALKIDLKRADADLPKSVIDKAQMSWLNAASVILDDFTLGQISLQEANDALNSAAHKSLKEALKPFANSASFAKTVVQSHEKLRK